MKTEVNIEITPAMMAERFWNMHSEDQCTFFSELAKAIGDNTYASQVQWWHLESELRQNDKARSTLMDIAAPLFWNTLKYIEQAR